MSSLTTLLRVSSVISCLSIGYVMGQEAAEATAEQTAIVYEIDGRKVEHTWTAKGEAIFGENGIERWRHYMHGLTDEKAQPFAWAPLISSDDELLLSGDRVRGDFVNSTLYSLCLEGGRSVRLVRPALTMADLTGKSGQIIRFHVWMKGEDTGQGGSLWDCAPCMSLWLQDSQGAEITRSESLFKTRGTFPWFCYTMSIRIPASFSTAGESGVTGGIYIELSNPTSGKAWFCTPSWEAIPGIAPDLLNGATDASWMDPKRGTFAPNPDYDELPMNFFFGLPEEEGVIWNFLDGNFAARSIVQNYDVKTYLKSAANDWFAMTQAVPYLLYACNAGTFLKHAPALQPGWSDNVVQTLADMQNPKTGLWDISGKGNLMATYLIARECFSPFRQARHNEKPEETAWRAAAGRKLPHAAELAESVLAAQMSQNGVLAGWNKYAFQGDDLLMGSRDAVMFDVRFSAAAVSLLSQCLPDVGDALKKRIAAAVRAAYDYAVKNVMDENWLWCTDEGKKNLSLTPFGFLFIEGTQACDCRPDSPEVRKPSMTVDFPEKGKISLAASGASPDIVSYRIYVQRPNDTTPLGDKNLAAIVRASDSGIAASDPLYLLKRFSEAQTAEGISRAMTADMAGADYLSAKITMLRNCSVATMNREGKATIALHNVASGSKISVFAADAYGAMSAPTTTVAP